VAFIVDARRQTILDAQEHCLVIGGAGSGKTTLALMKALKRAKGLCAGQEILFLSFSRSAVARIQDALKTSDLPPEVRARLSIQTFHSFFWSLVRANGYLLGAPRLISILASHHESALRGGIDVTAPEWSEERHRLFLQQGKLCFDLFAPLTRELLTKSRKIRRRVSRCYPLVIVDEAQDTSADQWECMRLIAQEAQLLCLGDLDQLIYDHLPGVGAQRLAEIRRDLAPLAEVDLGTDNNRSPGTEIMTFARDVLNNTPRGAPYIGVARQVYNPLAEQRDRAIRQSVGRAFRDIQALTGERGRSVAVLASYGKGVAIVSAALRAGSAIAHHVLFDESAVLHSTRFGAFLLEPRISPRSTDVITSLELLRDAQRCKATTTSLATAARYQRWADALKAGKPPKVNLVRALNGLFDAIGREPPQGDPRRDWVRVKRHLRESGEDALTGVANDLDYLVAFNRGERISAGLSASWRDTGTYAGARETLDIALTQEQLLSGGDPVDGLHVMNMHKAKGKQFDGVILYRNQHHSPFAWPQEQPPHARSRRLLHVAISRARKYVLILEEAAPPCPILQGYRFS
jgi:DNA helicase-2/ATP-dependent DNA helicase PcrA